MKKSTLKRFLGEIPLAAQVYWWLQQRTFKGRRNQRRLPFGKKFSLLRVEKGLVEWKAQAEAALRQPAMDMARQEGPRRILLFVSLRYWIEHGALLGTALAGLGHQVTLAYQPYPQWAKSIQTFDLERLRLYARQVLQQATPLIKVNSLLDIENAHDRPLPEDLATAIREVSVRDVQYTLQVENFDPESDLYRLRLERNSQAALAALVLMEKDTPDILLTPNGSILEMGAVYQTARHLGIPAVTYEFGEQRGRIWMAQNSEVMLQETDDLWRASHGLPLSEAQWEQIRALYASRQRGSLWENFSRLWQGQPAQGGTQVRKALGLDSRPLVLLPANVIGDSLTLGRQVFTQTMTEWLQGSVKFFAGHPEVQLVVRIHPGERYIKGPSVADVVKEALPGIGSDPTLAHIHLVRAADPVNTYDLVETADLGLAYTTTVGMEMAMSGVPVIVAGQTHYRAKGFTIDPGSWEDYFEQIQRFLSDPEYHRPTRQQLELAWRYAYRFFFSYPMPFPWHLLHYWKDLKTWSMERALSQEGQAKFAEAFDCLAGIPRRWEDLD